MDDKKQEWRRRQALMRLQGHSSWDIDIERDRFFKDEEEPYRPNRSQNKEDDLSIDVPRLGN